MSIVDKDTWQLLKDQLVVNTSVSSINTLLDQRGDYQLTASQLQNLRNNVLGVDYKDTPAQRMIDALENDPTMDYLTVVAKRSQGNLITIVQKRSSRKGKKKKKRVVNEEQIVNEDVAAVDNEGPVDFASRILNALELNDGQILLAVAWVSSKQRRAHEKFPEVLGGDVTHDTNSEQRPLFRLTGRSYNGKNRSFLNAFLPSQLMRRAVTLI